MNEITEERIREIIREEMSNTFAHTFSKQIQMLDGRNIQTGRTNGTKIGTGADQKIGFFNKTPVVQQTAPTALVESGADSDATARTAINTIRTALLNLGIIA